jgi:hypothetical protein
VQALRTSSRILAVIAVAALLAGCDKCGNWFFTTGLPFGAVPGLEACKGTVPQQK